MRIETADEALEYLRFFSSYRTVYLFDDQELEIFPGPKKCFATCLPSDRWKALDLEAPEVEVTDQGFTVSRYVIKPDGPMNVEVYRVVQLVSSAGDVEELVAERIDLPLEERLRLGFPHFM